MIPFSKNKQHNTKKMLKKCNRVTAVTAKKHQYI